MTMRALAFLSLACALAFACASAPPPPPAAASSTSTTSAVPPDATMTPTLATATPTVPTATPTSSATPTDTSAPIAAAHSPPPAQITARHVLIQYMGAQHADSSIVRTKEQAYGVAQEVLRRANAGEDFARLAVEFSDEPNAAARGGSLGRFGHGQMVHEFEDAAFMLVPGQISGIVETPFGFHIIQRTE
jgi:peptidyl-prolyl cis-trans isomerase NIMA-interacting 1